LEYKNKDKCVQNEKIEPKLQVFKIWN